jgi:deoxycytidylate deaminase
MSASTSSNVSAGDQRVVFPSPRESVLKFAANELVFAVVGYAGSGTSTVAQSLNQLLGREGFEVHAIRARELIETWAKSNGENLPLDAAVTVANVEIFQDLGDKMRKQTPDFASIAKFMSLQIRAKRAGAIGSALSGSDPVPPDGRKRAYVLDSIRHPAEVELLRYVYQQAFVLVGVVCEEDRRLSRLVDKYKDAGADRAREFMKRDARAGDKWGQRVSEAFHLSDFFVDNTVGRFLTDKSSNPDWKINDELLRLIKIVSAREIVRPTASETAMHAATAASMRSACLSRQVGAALLDASGNILATGTNEVPKAGGGVYGDSFIQDIEDHRCAFRRLPDGQSPYCSNNRKQNEIVDSIVNAVPELQGLEGMRKLAVKRELRENGIGDLIEFSRAVHAEMDALLSAGRTGAGTIGTRLFVTTFPCHYCARHIVSAGVDEVQYIEPYPKSRALELHQDSITIDPVGWKPPSQGGTKTLFRPFVGISPRLYRRAFLKRNELKDSAGVLNVAPAEWGSSMLLRSANYYELEAELAKA